MQNSHARYYICFESNTEIKFLISDFRCNNRLIVQFQFINEQVYNYNIVALIHNMDCGTTDLLVDFSFDIIIFATDK